MGVMNLRASMLAVVLLIAGLALAPTVTAGDDQRLVIFGDSLSDPGNAFVILRDVEVPPFELIPDAPYARGALHFSNGATWAEQLAGRLGARVSAGPALWLPHIFSNYAVGSARARVDGAFHLGEQVDRFIDNAGAAAPRDALYVVFVGGNDLRDALDALALDPSGAASGVIVQAALAAIRDNLLKLYAIGARKFLVPNAPNLALVPAVRLLGPSAQGAAQFLAEAYNDGLGALLDGLQASLSIDVVRFDVFALLNAVVANPAAVGLREVTQPCITPGTRVRPFCARPDEYLFWDGIHPTRAGHAILAERAAGLLD
jgi:outer membrane lipase/esterase